MDDRVLWIVYGVQDWDRTKLEMGTGYGMSYIGSTKIMYFSLDSVALGFRVCVLGNIQLEHIEKCMGLSGA